MTSAGHRYVGLAMELISLREQAAGRNLPPPSDDVESSYVERLDQCWRAMSTDEQDSSEAVLHRASAVRGMLPGAAVSVDLPAGAGTTYNIDIRMDGKFATIMWRDNEPRFGVSRIDQDDESMALNVAPDIWADDFMQALRHAKDALT